MLRDYQWTDSLIPAGPLVIPRARALIRESNLAAGRRLLVIDDDPTGSQTVHDVDAVLTIDPEVIARSLEPPGATCFVLTNSRSLSKKEAFSLSFRLGELAALIERQAGGRVEIISRSDSTLRGHLRAEITALSHARHAAGQSSYDGILLVPSYFEAGRFTAGDVHWAQVRGQTVAVGQTEFARDSSFGFSSSELPRFVEEKYDGAIGARQVRCVSLEDIRRGGPERVAALLTDLPAGAGTYVAVNGIEYADLDVVTLGVQRAEAAGRSFLYRSGPSFVQSFAGLEPRGALAPAAARPDRRPGHGLVVVGSHVGLTTRQVERLLAPGDVTEVTVDARDMLGGPGPALGAEVAKAAALVRDALDDQDVVLMTSRKLITGADAAASLGIARAVSAGLVAVVAEVARRPLPWIVTKGGITSHDVLARALRIRRAQVIGQLFPGFVSVLRPVDARPEMVGTPCVVFAGNVGDESSLRAAVEILRG
jgi:uncharacterized protein YgbK (DUF1537 family)